MRTSRFFCCCSFLVSVYWRISTHETSLRMRGRLEPNPWFSSHRDASVERDGFVRRISAHQLTKEDLDEASMQLLRPGIVEDTLDRILQDGCDGSTQSDLISALERQNRISVHHGVRKTGDDVSDIDDDVVGEEDWSMIKRDDVSVTGSEEVMAESE